MEVSVRVASLSARELEIANAYAGGANYREIAEHLFIAPSTVRTHLTTIYRKLGVSTKIELLNVLADSGEVGSDTTGSGGPVPAPPAPLIDDVDMSRVLGDRPTSPDPSYEFDLPPLPVIAVLPFANLSREAEQAFFADGLAEDIIARLSYLRGLVVVSRTTSFACRDRPAPIQDMATELGAGYLLEGSVRISGQRLRVTSQLVDGATGSHLWAGRYDRDLTDLFAIQDEITQSIVTAMRVELTDGEAIAAAQGGTDNLEAWEAFHQGVQAFLAYTPDSLMRARRFFSAALELAPDYLDARIYLAWCHWQDSHSMFSPDPDEELARARQQVDEIKATGRESASALHLEAATLILERHYDEALEVSARAVALGPCKLFGLTPACLANTFAGNARGGLDLLRITIRQVPSTPIDTVWWLGMVLCLLGDYDNAVLAAEEYARRAPGDQHSYTLTALAYAFSGQDDAAEGEIRKLLRLYPKYNVAQFRHHEAFRDRTVVDRMVAALQRAGLPG